MMWLLFLLAALHYLTVLFFSVPFVVFELWDAAADDSTGVVGGAVEGHKGFAFI